MNEPETKNEATAGKRGERVVGASMCAALDFDLGDVVREPAVGPFAGEDADTAVAGAAVGLDELRGGARVVMKGHSQGPPCVPLSYLSILTL